LVCTLRTAPVLFDINTTTAPATAWDWGSVTLPSKTARLLCAEAHTVNTLARRS